MATKHHREKKNEKKYQGRIITILWHIKEASYKVWSKTQYCQWFLSTYFVILISVGDSSHFSISWAKGLCCNNLCNSVRLLEGIRSFTVCSAAVTAEVCSGGSSSWRYERRWWELLLYIARFWSCEFCNFYSSFLQPQNSSKKAIPEIPSKTCNDIKPWFWGGGAIKGK